MKREFILAIIISFTFLTAGMMLLHYDLIGYGFSFFVFLPLILGYLLGKSITKTVSLLGLIVSLIVFLCLLYIGEMEGMICIFMSLPLVAAAVAIGVWLKRLIVKYYKSTKKNNTLKSSILPLCLFLILGLTEHQLTKNDQAIVAVSSTVVLPYSTLEVYEAIKSVDTLDAEKPFLMKLDLPIPQKCILEEEKVGGIRTCYFENGLIVEKITELEKGKVLRMDVIDYQLTGRKWLGFKEAIYTFEELENGKSKMTRITTYSSELYPRFYWQPLERIGIEQEHQYVFNNLEKDLLLTLNHKSKDQ